MDLFTHIQIQGVTLKCKTGKVYSGFYRRTNKQNANHLFSCPHTPPAIMTPFIFNINRILRQLRKPEWKLIPPHHQLSIALGSTPPPEWKLKVSQVDRLNRNLLNHCALLALRLSEYAKTLH